MVLLSFDYNGQREEGYVNLSQMCKANGKLFADWYKLQGTTLYLQELESDMKISISDLLDG